MIEQLAEKTAKAYQDLLVRARLMHPGMVRRIEKADRALCQSRSGEQECPIGTIVMFRYGVCETLSGLLMEEFGDFATFLSLARG